MSKKVKKNSNKNNINANDLLTLGRPVNIPLQGDTEQDTVTLSYADWCEIQSLATNIVNEAMAVDSEHQGDPWEPDRDYYELLGEDACKLYNLVAGKLEEREWEWYKENGY